MDEVVSQISFDKGCELLQAFVKAGLTPQLAQRVIESKDNAIARGIIESLISYQTYTVIVDYDKTVEEYVKAGQYDGSSTQITSKHFPSITNRTGKWRLEVVLLPFESGEDSQQALTRGRGLGLSRIDIKVGLAFGEQHPNVQLEAPIVILCEPWDNPHGHLHVPCLSGSGSHRSLYLISFEGDWNSRWRFALEASAEPLSS